jgi:4-hydroxybenzoate polyprenyltransferase
MSQVDLPLPPVAARPRLPALPLVIALRPRQWIKNLFVLSPLVFSGNLWNLELLPRALVAFAAFCGLASAVYLVNDLLDRRTDRLHPKKRHRPIARRQVTVEAAVFAAVMICAVSFGLSWLLGKAFFGCAFAYAGTMFAYCAVLRRVVVIDVAAIAIGFVLRVEGGAAAVGVPVSGWLTSCTVLLSLFLGFGKRRHELVMMGTSARRHRGVLSRYQGRHLDILIVGTAVGTVVTYGLYCVFSATAAVHPAIAASFPFVGLGIGRYLWHIYQREGGGNPEEVLLADGWFAAVSAGWLASILLVLR